MAKHGQVGWGIPEKRSVGTLRVGIHEKRTFVAVMAISAKKIGGKFGLKMA